MKVHARIWMTLFVIVPYAFWVDIYEGALLPRLLLLHVALSTIAVTAAFARRRSLVPQKVVILTILFIAFLLLSLFQSQNITESFVHLSQYGSLALLPLLMCFSVGAQDLMPLYRSIAIASIPISLLGIGQYLGIFPFDLPAHAHPSATFFHRNAAATYLTAIVPISALCFLTSACDRKRWFYGSATWLALAFLVFTRTRGAWVGTLVAGLTVFGLNRALGDRVGLPSHTAHRLFAMIATVVVLGSVIIPDRIPGGSAFDDKKASAAVALASIVSEEGHRGRTELWQKTFDIIADHPILGVGLGNWEFQFPAYADGQHLNVDAAPRRPHNDLLWLASETGLLGLLAYLAMIGLTLATATNIVRHESPERRAIALMAVFVVVAHLVDGMFNFPRERIGGASHFWLAIGTIWLMRPSDPMRMSRLAIASIAIGLLWCTQMTVRRIAYDYHHLRVHVAERDLDWQTVLDHGPKAAGYGNFRANTWIAMGRAKYRTGDPESAIVLHKKALTLHPNSLNAHNNLGIALRMVGRTEEAVIALQRAIQLYPTFVEAQNNLGNALRDLMRIQDSIDVFERVLRQGTAHIPTLHINLARSYIAAGDTIRARGSYSTALKLDPSNSVARRELDALRPKSPSSGLDRS